MSTGPVGDLPEGGGPPEDHRRTRYVGVGRFLRGVLVASGVLAIAATVLPDPWGARVGAALVVLLVAAPLLRVVWLVQRWFRRGDPRYALVGCGVLATVAAGVVIAALSS